MFHVFFYIVEGFAVAWIWWRVYGQRQVNIRQLLWHHWEKESHIQNIWSLIPSVLHNAADLQQPFNIQSR